MIYLLSTVFAVLLPMASAAEKSDRDLAVDLARKTVAESKEIAAGTLTLRKVRGVEWSDTSLGCPQPGKSYAQVVTPGFAVFLDADGALYAVHVAGPRAIICDRDQRGVARIAKKVPGALLAGVASARRELAAELGVAQKEVEVVSLKRVSWTDASQSCLKGLEATPESPIEGGLLTLHAKNKVYLVHIAGTRSARCTVESMPEQKDQR